MSDKLHKPKDIRTKIDTEEKYCTKPEFEILIIIAEGLYDEYQKVKSSTKPKTFAKTHIKHNGVRYNNTQQWIKTYFWKKDIKAILEIYKQKSNHSFDEKYLIDLIK